MRYYELTCIISKNLSEAEKNSLTQRVVSYLPNPPIKKEGSSSLITLEFYSEPEKISELQKLLKAETQIQKLMILTKKVPSKKRPPHPSPTRPRLAPRVERAPKKVELKEIEKKLEEILKQ